MKGLLICVLFFLSFSFLNAHEGPAFPVLVNKALKNFTLSIWADPDTGNGAFHLYFKPVNEEIESLTVVSYPLRKKSYQISTVAQKLVEKAGQQHYSAMVAFDSEEAWESEFSVKQKDGTLEKVRVQVDVTPPGPSKWEFALYFLPFLLIGFVWGKAYLLKKI